MSWWYPAIGYQMQIPECLMARGRTDRGGDGDFRFGSSMHGEEIWQQDKDNMPGFLGMFCRTTLPWYYLSRLEREKFENEALYYSDGVVARTEGGKTHHPQRRLRPARGRRSLRSRPVEQERDHRLQQAGLREQVVATARRLARRQEC